MWRAWFEGVKDGFVQVELSSGLTWDLGIPNHNDLNEAYDRGANLGEALARLLRRKVSL